MTSSESARESSAGAPPADDPRAPVKVAQRPIWRPQLSSADVAALADGFARVAVELEALGRAWREAARDFAPALIAALERLREVRIEHPKLFTHPAPAPRTGPPLPRLDRRSLR